MDIKQYAPVYIPTLNRYDHFKRCLDSLERCVGAGKTDVYIGLDYPPSEKYVDGWKKIDRYLSEKEKSNKFRNLFVRRRNHNCGIGRVGSNVSLLQEEIKKVSDRYIASEDDNEFSPNFLVYINKGLNKFVDDDRIYCICGYNRRIELPKSFTGNCYLAHDFVAWGVGYWTKKQRPSEYRSFDYLKKILCDREKCAILKKKTPESIRSLLTMLKMQKIHGDVLTDIYEVLEGKYSLMPTVTKVRNHGNDGTGVHSKIMISSYNSYYSEQPIDQDDGFEIFEDIPVEPNGVKVISPVPPLPAWKHFIKDIIFHVDLFMVRYFGFVPKSKYI